MGDGDGDGQGDSECDKQDDVFGKALAAMRFLSLAQRRADLSFTTVMLDVVSVPSERLRIRCLYM